MNLNEPHIVNAATNLFMSNAITFSVSYETIHTLYVYYSVEISHVIVLGASDYYVLSEMMKSIGLDIYSLCFN